MKRIVICSTLLILLMLLSGCLSVKDYQPGDRVPAENIIRHHGNAGQDFLWQDLFLTIHGTLEKVEEEYQLSGTVTFSTRSQAMFLRVEELKVLFVLLDHDERVHEVFAVMNSSNHQPDEELPFSLTWPKFSSPDAMAFGYDVSFIDDLGLSNRYRYYPLTDE